MARFGPALCAVLLACPSLHACSVPVFRYALERWQPARYELVLYHRGPLPAADRDAAGRLEKAVGPANVVVTDIDLDTSSDRRLRAVWEHEGKDVPLPRLVLRYPDAGPQIPSLWSGPVSADALPALLDSPARRQLFDRLTTGHAAAVVLLLSGDATADEAARTFLRAELPKIASQIELPAKTDDGPQVQSVMPLRVGFPVIEVARTPAEDVFVRMLLGSEDGLDKVKGPIAFPVFGRGRALCSLHGKDLQKPGELRRSLEFLCRACSCQVKELNPGVDLLIAGSWDLVFAAERGPAPRVVPAPTTPITAETRLAPAAGPPPVESRSPPPPGYSAVEAVEDRAPPRRRAPWLRLGTVGAAALVVLTGLWALRSRRPPPPPAS